MPAISKKRLAQMDAHEQLVLKLMDYAPEAIPCRGPRSGAWHSGNATLQDYAAKACWECPLVQQCREYALKHEPDRTEVWGGMKPRQKGRPPVLDLEGVA